MITREPLTIPSALGTFLNEARAAGCFVQVERGTYSISAKVDDVNDTLSERYPAVRVCWTKASGFTGAGFIEVRSEGLTTYHRVTGLDTARRRLRLPR